ncbi:MAG TPA: 3'-5' exonuclease [Bacteroidaceae bacterium]|nr:3'-5' exonuclease [Bacteroidaceae bacterium]
MNRKLQLTRPLVVFDLETTGTDTVKDRIVEICLIKVYPNGNEESRTMRINPEQPIPASASAVHGIYDEDVKDCPTFKDAAEDLAAIISDSDLAGFNSNRFDVPMLAEEFIRAGVQIDLSLCKLVDVQVIFHKREQRTLVAAYKFYCDGDLTDAHSAEADTKATLEVLKSQVEKYDDLPCDIDGLSEYSTQNRTVDFAQRIVLNENDEPVFNFGKFKGQSVKKILRNDSGYYNWMMQSDFPRHTKAVLTRLRLEAINGQ